MKKHYYIFAVALALFAAGEARAAVQLEDYSSTSSLRLYAGSDSGSSSSLETVAGVNGNAARLTYSLGSGSYVYLGREYTGRDFSAEGGNALRFRYRSSGNANTLEVKFTDNDSTNSAKCDKMDLKFLMVPDNQWRTVDVVFSSFSIFSDGNSMFDLGQVSRMMFGITQDNSTRGSGSVFLDQVELYRSTWTLVNDFAKGADPNYFGGNTSAFGGSPAATSQYVLDNGNIVLKFNYSVLNANEFGYLTMGLANHNFQGYTHLSFRIRGNAGGEKVKVGLENTNGQTKVFVSTYLAGGVTTSFQQVYVPMAAFFSTQFSSVNVVSFEAGNDYGSGAGSVYIDDIAFVRMNEAPGVVRVLDDMDSGSSETNWETYKHDDASLAAAPVADVTAPGAGPSNRVARLDYDFTTSPSKPAEIPWAVIERPLQLSLAPFYGLRFRYNGTGSANNVEFKLTDHDGTVWYKKFLVLTNTDGAWKTAVAPLSQFMFFSAGDDSYLNLKRIKKIDFAVTKGSGGTGTFSVDSIEGVSASEQESVMPGRLVSSMKVVNNPFSPNGDGVKEEVFFVYNLDGAAKVTMKVYTVEGDEVKTIADEDQNSGEHGITWDGRDRNGEKVRNGLYITRLEAAGSDGRKDEVKTVIGVIK